MVKFLFSVHTITKEKQSNRQGGARAVDLSVRSFHLARPGVAPPLYSRSACRLQTHRDLKCWNSRLGYLSASVFADYNLRQFLHGRVLRARLKYQYSTYSV